MLISVHIVGRSNDLDPTISSSLLQIKHSEGIHENKGLQIIGCAFIILECTDCHVYITTVAQPCPMMISQVSQLQFFTQFEIVA